jgi:transcriptional regulator with XRE-family HTH domain
MNAYEKIGKKLQEAREEAGLSQEELARKIGCTQASLSNYELGKRRLYLADLQRIGQLLGKQITYFLDESPGQESAHPDELLNILEEQYLREILLAAKELKSSQRKSVLDYIQWQKDEGSKK